MILKLILRSIEMVRRSLKNLIFRPIYIIKNKFFRIFNVSRYISKLQQSIMKLPLKFKVKPEKREDYVDAGPFYLAKSILALCIIGIIVIPLLIYFIIWPLLVTFFFTANFYIRDPKLETYSGKVRVYYEKEFENLAFKGKLKKGVKLDYGEEYYEDGVASYRGNFKDDLYDKKGVTYDKQGVVIYDGEFLEGLYDGDGILYLDNYLRYEGEFEKGNINGRGKYYSQDTLIFEGSFLMGKKDGRGKEYSSEDGKLVYEGMFLDDQYDGEGTAYYSNGNVLYSGNFKKGQYSGQGILKREDGTKIYEGDFEEDLYNGEGTTFDEDQSIIYKGSVVNGLYEGTGILNVKDEKLRYEGTFVEGKLSGQGKLYKEGKLYYEGSFSEGMLGGSGKLTDNDADFIYEGNFKYNDIDMENLFAISTEEIYPLFTKGLEEIDKEDHFYLYNKKQGIVLDVLFAKEDVPSKLSVVYRLPMQSMAKEIKGKQNILPYPYTYKNKSEVPIPSEIKKLLNLSSGKVICHQLKVDDMLVNYWVNEKTGKIELIGYISDLENQTDESSKSDSKDPEEIEELLKALGIEQEEAVKMGIIEPSEEIASSQSKEKTKVDMAFLETLSKAVNRNKELNDINSQLQQLSKKLEGIKNSKEDESKEIASTASEINALKNQYIDKKNDIVCQFNTLLLDCNYMNQKIQNDKTEIVNLNNKVTAAEEAFKKGKMTLSDKKQLEKQLKEAISDLRLSHEKLAEYEKSYLNLTGEALTDEKITPIELVTDPTAIKWPAKKLIQPTMVFSAVNDVTPNEVNSEIDFTKDVIYLLDEYKAIGDLTNEYIELVGNEKTVSDEVNKGQKKLEDLKALQSDMKQIQFKLSEKKAEYTKKLFEMEKESKSDKVNELLGHQIFSNPMNTEFNLESSEEFNHKGGKWILYNKEGKNLLKVTQAPEGIGTSKYFVMTCENKVLGEGKIGQEIKINPCSVSDNMYITCSFYGTDKNIAATLLIDGTSNSGEFYSEGDN